MEKKETVRFKVFGYLAGEAWEIADKHAITGKLEVPVKMLGKLRERITLPYERNTKLARYFYIPIVGNKVVRLERVAKIIGDGDRILASRLAHISRSTYKNLHARAQKAGVTLAAIDVIFSIPKIKDEMQKNPLFYPKPEEKTEEVIFINPEDKSYLLKLEGWELSSNFNFTGGTNGK